MRNGSKKMPTNIERQKALWQKKIQVLENKVITNNIHDYDWLLHNDHIRLIKNNDNKLLFIETPFHLPHTDVPFDQISYFENILQHIQEHLPNIKQGKTKLIYWFADAWGTVNAQETHKQYSGCLLALDLYNLLYQISKEADILEHSVFVTGTSTNNVNQYKDWPIVYYNEPFNRYFSIGNDLKIRNRSFHKHFLWLNRRTRDHRLYALHQAYKAKLFNNTKLTFHDFETNQDQYKNILKNYTNEIDLDFLNYRTNANILDSNYDIQNDDQQRQTLLNLKHYADKCSIEIVSEYMGSDKKVFLTEKISRSIVMGKPFIVIGDKHMLKELQTLGFKTFDKFWNESYDELPTIKQRVDAVIKLAVDLSKSIKPAEGYDKHMIDILLYNQNHYFGAYKQSQLKAFKDIIK